MNNRNDTNTPKYLAYLLVFTLVGVAAALFRWEIPTGNKEVFTTVIQTILTLAAAAVFFHVGSSSGSRLKDKPAFDPDGGAIHVQQKETVTTETQTQQAAKPKEL